jgi:predicted permease
MTRWWRGLTRKRDLEAEIQEHLALETDENIERGLAPEEARRAALRSFGNVALAAEQSREVWSAVWLEHLVQDLRYGARTLLRNPGFTSVAVLTLALGIGANTAIFSVLDAVLLKLLPVAQPDQLVIVKAFRGSQNRDLSYPLFREMAARQQVFAGMTATGGTAFLRVAVEGIGELPTAENIRGRLVSTSYFSVLGVRPLAGRLLEPGETQTAVISHGFWERQFGRDPSVVGRILRLNGAAFTIVGVTPREFFGEVAGSMPDLWIPIESQPRLGSRNMLEVYTATWFSTVARLAPGVDSKRAAAMVTALYRQLVAEAEASGKGSLIHGRDRPDDLRIELEAGSKGLANLRRRFSEPLRLLMAVVALVLLIACCNVANLLVARGAFRQKEVLVRLAIGASRRRLVRQFLTESLLLATLGGTAGLGLARFGTDLLLGVLALQVDLPLDLRTLGFTAALSLVTGVVFGLVPALQATRARVAPSLQEAPRRVRALTSRALVVLQVALSLVLFVGTGLLVRSLRNLAAFDAGFERHTVLLVDVSRVVGPARPAAAPLVGQVLERVRVVPGVRSASASSMWFFGGSATTAPVRVPDSRVDPARDGEVRQEWVTPGYFATLGMRLLVGRDFEPRDAGGLKVAVINETAARHYFGASDPRGRLIYFPHEDAQGRYIPFSVRMERDQAVEVIGVVTDAKYDNLRQTTPRMVYVPLPNSVDRIAMEIRTVGGDPAALIAPVRAAITGLDPDLIVRNSRTLTAEVDRTLGEERLIARLLGFFAVLALLLACVGLYGVMSFQTARRTREIGIRMALGATSPELLRMVMRETLGLAALGVLLGIPAALGASRLVERLLFGLDRSDPRTIELAAICLLATAALAGYAPARRAARVDPMGALRQE